MSMNLEKLIKEKAIYFKATRREIYISPDIPEEVMSTWKKKYDSLLPNGLQEYILVISYTKTGSFVLTGDAIYYDNFLQGGIKILRYIDICRIELEAGKLFTIDKIWIWTKTGEKICLDGCLDGINTKVFENLMKKIIYCASIQRLVVSRQSLSVCECTDEIKLLYLEILCNYAYLHNSIIDSDEYNAISSFSVRMGVGAEVRKQLRSYMSTLETRQKTGRIIKKIKNELQYEAGQWDVLRYSLMQDVLYIHNLHDKQQSWKQDGFVGGLMEALELKPQQMDTMLYAIDLNNQMQLKYADMKALKKKWKNFVDQIQYTERYIPTPYLFCSGSVYSISNYSGFMRFDDASDEAINKQRELILYQIIENIQETINILIEDMNDLAEKLEKETEKSEKVKAEYNALKTNIKEALSRAKERRKQYS